MDRKTLLRNIPLFESLSPEDLDALAARFEERQADASSIIFRRGESGSTLYVIRDGGVEISTGEGRQKIVLTTLFEGQYFGELSLLDGAPRSATATTLKPCEFLALDRDDFVEFLRKKPDAAISIMSEMGERIRRTNDLMSGQVARNVIEEVEETLTFGQRVADRVATFGGSWSFIGLFSLFMALWMLANAFDSIAWDPMPYILLNLMLSTIAALQAPVIMMSQNRQASKDKALATNDFQVNLKNEMGIERILATQGEILQRVVLVERQITSSANRPTTGG